MKVPEIWIKVDSVSRENIRTADNITEKFNGDVQVILYADSSSAQHKTKKMTSLDTVDEFKKHFGQDNVTKRESIQIMDKDQVLFTEVAVIRQYGFTTAEAIEILKLAELRELNAQLRDAVYISGDVNSISGKS